MSRQPSAQRRRSAWLYTATAAAVATAAALLWLRQSNDLASTGLRIYDLETRREELLQTRSLWLGSYAQVTSPTVLAKRARELGFGPASDVDYVAVELPHDHGSPVAAAGVGSVFAMIATAPAPDVSEPGLVARLMRRDGGAVVASAAGGDPVAGSPP